MKFLILTVLFSGLVFVACKADTDSYRVMTVKNRIAGFSFEYRAYYNDLDGPSVQDTAARKFTYVTVLAPKNHMRTVNPMPGGKQDTVVIEYTPASIEVSAADYNKYHISAHEYLQASLSGAQKWPNFKLLEQYTTTVGGVQAEVIVYQVDGIFGPPLKFNAAAYWQNGDLVWSIEADAEIGMADTVRSDFDHVLQTFKILD